MGQHSPHSTKSAHRKWAQKWAQKSAHQKSAQKTGLNIRFVWKMEARKKTQKKSAPNLRKTPAPIFGCTYMPRELLYSMGKGLSPCGRTRLILHQLPKCNSTILQLFGSHSFTCLCSHVMRGERRFKTTRFLPLGPFGIFLIFLFGAREREEASEQVKGGVDFYCLERWTGGGGFIGGGGGGGGGVNSHRPSHSST